jgi:signal transduction histidine kinase
MADGQGRIAPVIVLRVHQAAGAGCRVVPPHLRRSLRSSSEHGRYSAQPADLGRYAIACLDRDHWPERVGQHDLTGAEWLAVPPGGNGEPGDREGCPVTLSWLAFAEGRAAGPGTVVWELSRLAPHAQAAASPGSPWGNLSIALYSSPHPDSSALIVATSKDLPLAGLRYPFRVGADTWLLVTASPHPLVGALAENTPWILLAGGVFTAVLVTAIVETLVRRRKDTEALVAQRTASLRTAMTELEAAQAQLVRQERLAAVGQLASTVGHELRNPLAVVSNVLYLLEASAGPDAAESTRRHLATAKREVAAATVIVSDLLDYSAGHAPIKVPVPVPDLISEVLSVVPPPAGVRVDREDEADAVIDADHDQIRQALLNLITNAYDAMPDGGVLTISTAPTLSSVQITVTDTGEGMTVQAQEKIFTPFYTSKMRGIGLGLAVTRRIVEAHGGAITVHSAPSAGSSFIITVPAAMASVPQ